jgi:ATP-dependent exoDNAse (exonuclease V) beta subunit
MMSNSPPPDQPQRQQALHPDRSILVQAPAGSGKTDLLTRRFLCLLAQVDEPGQLVAITFTNAAAAEMRNRILNKLEEAAAGPIPPDATDELSMESLACRALEHSQARGWNLLDLPAQLRISTIDSFCRDLALQQPLLSGLGGGLAIAEQPADLYRRAARQTLEQIDSADPNLPQAIAALLEGRDNNWQDTENLLVQMLGVRDRWMQDFVLESEQDWEALRERLERPFANAVRDALSTLGQLFDQVPGACEEALRLARFACEQSDGQLHQELAELAEFPTGSFAENDALEEARDAYLCLGTFLLTGEGEFRKQANIRHGFPADRKHEKAQFLALIARLNAIPGLESALAAVRVLPPARYTDEDWQIVRACFTLLRHAAAQLQVVFAEAGAVDFIEVAQIAQAVLKGPEGLPTDAALAVSDGIRHLLVDEFQDTSRRQHQLLAGLIAAWPERTGRTCFAVGDPMQSIYFFRDADAELFPRVRDNGLEIPQDDPLLFDFVPLSSNFRTAPSLVDRLNEAFDKVFAEPDGSGVSFTSAQPARTDEIGSDPRFHLHLQFASQTSRGKSADPQALHEKDAASAAQVKGIVALIQSHMAPMEVARQRHEELASMDAGSLDSGQQREKEKKYRIAVLARARKSLTPIAQALRGASIPFRAVELEKLADRPEVLDALALARALLNPYDRVAWLGVLRAPWCGLALDDLHLLTSADEPALLARPIPDLLAERLPLLSADGRQAAQRVLAALNSSTSLQASQPIASPGTRLQQIWLRLGGEACVDATARANLDLLWSCLDRLPAGQQDLLGPALDAALDKLTALPDPNASSDFGVQLMTIHKSKGLEFEVVIVPDLQAQTARGSRKLLSWLERGLVQRDESGEITEFLVAPLPPKGADRGKAKAWVDQVYRERESQEDRRIFYVAATRSREELHLFAQPAFKVESDGTFTLPNPSASLMATAWPALEEEVRARFDDWKAARPELVPAEEQIIESIAASAQSNVILMPTPARPTLLRRLPLDYQPTAAMNPAPDAQQMPRAPSIPRFSAEWVGDHEPQPAILSTGTSASTLYPRHRGCRLSRALGTAVHALLEQLAQLRTTNDWNAARAALGRLEPRIAAQVRASGVDPAQAVKIAAQALALALNASRDPNGQWILSPHADAVSEVRWAGVVAGLLSTVRADRVFRAGLTPRSEGQQAWWIVDYKTAHADDLDPSAALPQLRPLFAPQLEAYAEVLRKLHGPNAPIRAALYYPRMLLLDWWDI